MLSDVIERYLDSLDEREFDAPFIALLRSLGYWDIHFLHGGYEFGKDFIAKARVDGLESQFAFQTKAGDINRQAWDAARGQIDLLRTDAAAHPSFDRTLPRKAVFVTTGRFVGGAPIAAQNYRNHLASLGEITFTTWERQDLIQLITSDPRVLLASDAQGAFLMLLGQIDEGKTSDPDIEGYSRRWLSSPKSVYQLTIEAAVIAQRLRNAKRLDLACLTALSAFTDKSVITDPTYEGWEPVAPVGDLCPTSRTSVSWEQKWPLKPDVVLKGGNWAALGDQTDCPDDLGLLTTYRDPNTRHFDIFRDTSAATALGANLAGKIIAAMPQRWPETIRALMIHSAEWTPAMRQKFDAAGSEQQKRVLLRKYGYGVPDYYRAVLSAANDLTLIAEDSFQPFQKDGGAIKTRHMNLHQFPWPRAELEQLGETEVELRVTLSYYVEPNPGERGWLRRHRYPSYGLRFAVKKSLESVDAFRTRINAAAVAEEEELGAIDAGSDDWFLGARLRNLGSVHSDYWRGTAAELARRSAIGVYPIGGWWKENPAHQRYDRPIRYALIVSIRAVNGTIDIYTPVMTEIATQVEVTT